MRFCVQEFINLHVDECLRRQEAALSTKSNAGRFNGAAANGKGPGAGRRGPVKKLEVPPKLAAHLLSDRQLKEQLKRYELPIVGKKEVRLLLQLWLLSAEAQGWAAMRSCVPPSCTSSSRPSAGSERAS